MSPRARPPPSEHSIRAAEKMASSGSYGLSLRDRSARTAYSANVAGSNCMGPSAPLRFLPWWTPRAKDRPLSDSIVPIAASTSQASPRQVRAASLYQVRYGTGMVASPEGADPAVAAVALPAGISAATATATAISAATHPPRR